MDKVEQYVRDSITDTLIDNGLDDMGVDDALTKLFMAMLEMHKEGWL